MFSLSSQGHRQTPYTDKQSTPTPYRISMPLAGEWIYDKHERSFDCFLPVLKNLAIFYERIKHETLHKYFQRVTPLSAAKLRKKCN